MRYDIELSIRNRYPHCADHARYLLRLCPRDLDPRQTVSAADVTVTPVPAERREFVDFFGNRVLEIAYASSESEVRMDLKAQVERRGLAVPPDSSPTLSDLPAQISAVDSLAAEAPHHFLGASARVAPHPQFQRYAQAHSAPDRSVLDGAIAIGRALHRDMRFDPEATTVDTPALEAFSQRHGVCQDYAHIMIGALRSIGIPAGYVSGFLRTNPPPGKPRLEGADAMHAWVQFWCGLQMGWIEYDPTNAMYADVDHVVIARGRDYSDVSPIKGALRSAGEQHSEQRVTVRPLEPGHEEGGATGQGARGTGHGKST
ncbi:MAG: transglutaminase family protein [Lysobacterales bacterium]|nr:transglutaminase family protein [Xanthomonadales bacterium]MCP5473518.1 transglutaminase family protein [Rhodanobacteraceae bacterium]